MLVVICYKVRHLFQVVFCLDMNECETGSHRCRGNAQCVNVIGSYRCTCPEGYSLDANRNACLGKFA